MEIESQDITGSNTQGPKIESTPLRFTEKPEQALSKLEEVDQRLEESLGEEESKEDPLVEAWVSSVHEAYHQITDELVDVAISGKEPEEALESAYETIAEYVVEPFYEFEIEDRVSSYDNMAEVFAARNFESLEENVLGLDGADFHFHTGELIERYNQLKNLYDQDEENRLDWSVLQQDSYTTQDGEA